MGSGASGTQIGTCMGCQHCRQQLNPFYHKVGPYYFFSIDYFYIAFFEKIYENQWDRQKEIFHPLVQSPNAHNRQCCTSLRSECGTLSVSPTWWQESKCSSHHLLPLGSWGEAAKLELKPGTPVMLMFHMLSKPLDQMLAQIELISYTL